MINSVGVSLWILLRDIGISDALVLLIMKRITISLIRVLWNAEVTEKFYPSQRIRQGDPLSPYIFVMNVKRLTHLINSAIEDGRWKPIRIARKYPQLSCIFFVDDIVLFAEALVRQAEIIRGVFKGFCQSLRQRVSYNKILIYVSTNVIVEVANDVSVALRVLLRKKLGLYLSMSTIHGRVTVNTYKHLVDRVYGKLVGWKA